MRPIALLLVTTAVVAVLAWLVDARSKPAARTVRPVGSRLTQFDIYAPGQIEGADEPIRLRAELTGRVIEVLVREGDYVEAGQPLVRLDSELIAAELAEAEAQAAAATARLARVVAGPRAEELKAALERYKAASAAARQAHQRWQRRQALWERAGADTREVEDQQYAYLVAAARAAAAEAEYLLLKAGPRQEDVRIAESLVSAAQARVRLLRHRLERLVIRAPVAGQVLQVNCRVGELLSPDAQTPAVVLVDRSRSHVRAFVEEYDAARVHAGMSAVITVDGKPGQELKGIVRRVSPIVQRKTLFTFEPTERYDSRVREVWIELDSAVDLPVGLRVHVRILRGGPNLATGESEQHRSAAQLQSRIVH